MKFLVCLSLILLLSERSVTQDSSIVVNSGARIDEAIPAKDLYEYPDFLIGRVFFRDGRVVEARMNYNRFTDEMFFIRANGDTLVLDNEETIRLINIEKDSFYFNKGFILLVQTNNAIKLGVKHGFRLADKRKSVSYDMMSSISSVQNIRSIEEAGARHRLVAKEQLVLFKTEQYYFGDKFDFYVLANQKNLSKMFPACNGEIKNYCSKNKIDFGKKTDLDLLLPFIASACR